MLCQLYESFEKMVLWKKESQEAEAPFVDLFKNGLPQAKINAWNRKIASGDWKSELLFDKKMCAGKNNQNSTHIRAMGNEFFDEKNWYVAMEFYSKSLCFAVPGTENESLAYANRASCFLRLNRFDECLRDIDLAKNAGYPNMPKLMARKAQCEHTMKIIAQRKLTEAKLDFPKNEMFPCMANVLEVKQNAEYGRHIVANDDIDVGQTVLIEKGYISLGSAPDRVLCYHCMTGDKNFIACPNCTDVMFCNEKCRDENIIHKELCGANLNRMPHDVRYLAESALMGIFAFPTADEMMPFTLETILKRGQQMPTAANDLKSKYQLFLNLQPDKPEKLDLELVYKAFTALIDNSKINCMFDSVRSKRFLMHLIAEHSLIISNNVFVISVSNGKIGMKMGLVTSLFNHSCAPNIFNGLNGDTDVFITVRPIKKGDQLFVTYKLGDWPTSLRRMTLEAKFGFLCKCDKCLPRCPEADRLAMKLHPNFQLLRGKQQFNIPKLKEACAEFLRTYGHLPWSEEMDVALKMYTQILFNEYFKKY